MDSFSAKDKKWYQLTHEEALKVLGSTPEGLPSSGAALRLEKYGPNKLGEEEATSLGQLKDSVVILMVIIINSIIGSWQELRAERNIRALQRLSVPKAQVLRDGEEIEVDSASLVPLGRGRAGLRGQSPCGPPTHGCQRA